MAKCGCGCGQETRIADRTFTKYGIFKGQPLRFIRGHSGGARPGKDHPGWKGGRQLRGDYIVIYQPGHHRADKKGYVFEHILVAEQALGRSILISEAVHHIDGKKRNNVPGNLMVFATTAMHTAFERRKAA